MGASARLSDDCARLIKEALTASKKEQTRERRPSENRAPAETKIGLMRLSDEECAEMERELCFPLQNSDIKTESL